MPEGELDSSHPSCILYVYRFKLWASDSNLFLSLGNTFLVIQWNCPLAHTLTYSQC